MGNALFRLWPEEYYTLTGTEVYISSNTIFYIEDNKFTFSSNTENVRVIQYGITSILDNALIIPKDTIIYSIDSNCNLILLEDTLCIVDKYVINR